MVKVNDTSFQPWTKTLCPDCFLLKRVCHPADIGAKAYASSAPEHSFSTEEVILSMLQHDSRFRQLLDETANRAGIDRFWLECTVADTYRYFVQHEAAKCGRGRRPAFEYSSLVTSSRPCSSGMQKTLPDVTLIIPGYLFKFQQIALESLYQYWGIPCVPDTYRK